LKTVVPQGDGVYKGLFWFWAEIWHLKILCEYWDLSVNTDNVMVKVDYESVYNPQFLLDVDAAKAYIDSLTKAVEDLTSDGLPPNAQKVDFVIPDNPEYYYDAETGVLVIYDTEGNPHAIELPKKDDGTVDFPATIVDAAGKIYELKNDENGRTMELSDRQQRESGEKKSDGDINIYFVIKKLDADVTVTDEIAEKTVKEARNYYSSNSTITLDEGRYLCIPVRKNIRYSYSYYDSTAYITDTITKVTSQYVPYGMRNGETNYSLLSWKENPYNRYNIEQTINGTTKTTTLSENCNYVVLNLTGGTSNSFSATMYVENAVRFGDWKPSVIPDELPSSVPYNSENINTDINPYLAYYAGKLKIEVRKHDVEAVWFDKDELLYDGSFGFDGYDEQKLKAFEDKYELLDIVKSDGSRVNYRVPAVSMWAGQRVTIKAKIKENTALGDSVYYRFVPENGLIIENIQYENGTCLNGEFKDRNKNYELKITLKNSNTAKGALLIKDRNGKTVGKLNFYSKEKSKITDEEKIKYRIVNVTFGNTPPNTAPEAIDFSNYTEGSPLENYLNNNSYNQAFYQFKCKGIDSLVISDSLIAKKPIIIVSDKLDSLERNRAAIRELLVSEYKKKSGIIANERIIFLVNNREMTSVAGFANRPLLPIPVGTECYVIIFKPALTDWETFVHEAGHNFGLKHPFETNGFIQGSSSNYMDYTLKKDMFWRWQWGIINNADFK
jgi:hypothetical protein